MKFRGNQEILNEMEKVWNTVARIEKASKEMLDEGNPILESLGFAWVHMMNACQEIEDNLNQGTGNKLEPKTLAQIIDVLTKIKWTGAKSGLSVLREQFLALSDFLWPGPSYLGQKATT